jgi:hypothetical protein
MKPAITLLLAACLGITACASSGTNAAAATEEPTTVVVDNQALMDMTIYVYRGSQRLRLGLATGVSKTRFTIPRGIVQGITTLRFQADPIGSSRAPISEQITVNEGDEVGLRIPPTAG